MAANKTALQIVNYVLRRMRELEVADFNQAYTKLILDFVNETQDEVAHALNWDISKVEFPITLIPATFSYELTDFSEGFLISAVMNTTKNYRLSQETPERMDELFNIQSTVSTGQPDRYSLAGIDGTSKDPIMEIWPVPLDADTLVVFATDPNPEMTLTTDIPQVRAELLQWGTIAKAIADRGEASAAEVQLAQMRYDRALSDYVAVELAQLGTGQLRPI